MPLLETRHVKAIRKERRCEECGRWMNLGEPAVAMYGMAHEGEKPWWMYTHPRGGCPWPTYAEEARSGDGIEGGRGAGSEGVNRG